MAIAYSVKTAAAQIGISEALVREAIRDGDLNARYVRSKAIIEHAELERYVQTLPTEREERAA